MRRKLSIMIAMTVCLILAAVAMTACTPAASDSETAVAIRINNFPESAATVYQGDGLSLDGCSIMVDYESGANAVIPMSDPAVSVDGFSVNTVGTQTITITYRGMSVTAEVEVLPLAVTDVAIDSMPEVITVVEGGELSVDGISLRITYQNGRSVVMDRISADMVTGYSTSLSAGVHTVYVNYYGFSLPVEIVVEAKTITSVSVYSLPADTVYFVGEILDLRGFAIVRNYDNNTSDTLAWSEENSADFEIEYDFSYANGRARVGVTYGGRYTSFNVMVIDPSCESVEILTYPVTVGFASTEVPPSPLTEVVEGDRIDWSTGVARVAYDNGHTEDIPLDDNAFYMYVNGTDSANYVVDKTNYTFDTAGEVSVYVRYGSTDIYALMPVSVSEKSPFEMYVVDANPSVSDRITQKTFASGTTLSTGWLKYNILYNNETYEFAFGDGSGSGWGGLSEAMLADGSSLTLTYNSAADPGDGVSVQTVTFTARGEYASFDVRVAAPAALALDIRFPYKTAYLQGTDRDLDYTGTSLYAELNTGTQISYSVLTSAFVGEYGAYYALDASGAQSAKPVGNVFNTPGDYRLAIEYYGMSASFDFTVVNSVNAENYVSSIEVYDAVTGAALPEGSVGSFTDYASLLAAYDLGGNIGNGTTTVSFDIPLSEAELKSGLTTLTGTAQTFVFGYNGAYVRIGALLTGRTVTSVSVSKAPAKSVYAPGESFDGTGLELTKVYNDGTTERVAYPNASISFGEIEEGVSGLYSLPVYYTSSGTTVTAYTDIIVSSVGFDGIAFDATQEGMTEYADGEYALVVTLGEDLSVYWGDADNGVSKLSFTALMSDGSEIEVPLGAEYVSYDRNLVSSDWTEDAAGNRYTIMRVPITYDFAVAYITLYVSDRQLESIDIIAAPSVVDYAEGQQLSLSGGYIRRNYSDGAYDVIPMTDGLLAVSGYIVSPFGSGSVIGTSYRQTVTVRYGNASAKFYVTTYRKIVVGISGADRISLSGTADEYGDLAEPIVGVISSTIPGVVLPETAVEYLVDGEWVTERPVYPGEYALNIIVFGNEYFERTELEYGTFTVMPRTLFVEIHDVSKVYGTDDPAFTYSVDEGAILAGDTVEITLSRAAGEDAGTYTITAALTAGANDNALYTLVADNGILTITQRTVTSSPDGSAINVKFDPPQGYNPKTGTFVATGTRIGAFTARYYDENGLPQTIDLSDIEYYALVGGSWVLLTDRPLEAGTYQVRISDNYSFRGTSTLEFRIISATTG